MIQRIQTLYLALAGLGLLGTFGLPFAATPEAVATSQLFADGHFDVHDHVVLTVLAALGGLTAFAAIFLFKNRPLQLRITLLSLVAAILLLIVAVVLFLNDAGSLGEISPQDGWGVALPLVAIVLLILAQRRIRKDEELVRSMDRLR